MDALILLSDIHWQCLDPSRVGSACHDFRRNVTLCDSGLTVSDRRWMVGGVLGRETASLPAE